MPTLTKILSLAVLGAFVTTACTPVKDTTPTKHKKKPDATQPTTTADNTGDGSQGTPSTGSEVASTSDGSGSAIVYVLNSSVESICYLYLGDGGGNWTSDLLGDTVLDSDYYYTIDGVTPGTVELYAEGCGGSTWYGSGDVSGEYTFILTGGSADTGGYYYYDSGYY